MTEISLRWNGVTQKNWDILLKQTSRCSFQQAYAYGEIFEQSQLQVDRFVGYDKDEAVAMGQIVTRRFFGFLKFTLLLKGPVWLKNISDEQKRQILNLLRKKYPLKYFNLFAFSPENMGSDQNEFHEIITGNSTILIDLTQSQDQLWQNLYGKNRTDIRKAEKAGLEMAFGDHNHRHTDWLLKQEQAQQKQNKYQGLPVGLVAGYGACSMPDQGVYTAFALGESDDKPMAGVLFLRHGRSATYHIGWNGRRGRKCRALNLLLWTMIIKLKEAGVETLDLGGVNTEEGADIARYKLSFGGTVHVMGGTFM